MGSADERGGRGQRAGMSKKERDLGSNAGWASGRGREDAESPPGIPVFSRKGHFQLERLEGGRCIQGDADCTSSEFTSTPGPDLEAQRSSP